MGAYPGPVRLLRRVGASAVLLALGACAQPPAPPAAQLWTLFDVEAIYAGGATDDHALAADAGLPGGIPIGHVLDGTTLFQRPALIEATGGSYLTTEVWVNYDQVWMQPMYVPVTGWVDGVPQKLLDANGAWHPVFSVGPGSGFYSPFWQAVYFTVPPGTTTATYTSATQILDSGLPLVPREGWTISIVPADVTPPAALAGGSPKPGTGWLDGAMVSTLKFGERLFTWDPATNVVDETPLFLMVTRDADGNLVQPYLPTVGGLGPVGAHVAAAPRVGTEPIYASYWRLYTVEIPTTARVVADAALQQELDAAGLHDLGFPVDPNVAYDTPSIVGRVLANPTTCTRMDPSDAAFDCTYLDSQAAIEANVDPGAIAATAVTATCPFVTWNETALLPPIVNE